MAKLVEMYHEQIKVSPILKKKINFDSILGLRKHTTEKAPKHSKKLSKSKPI